MFLTKGFRKETKNLFKNMWTDRVLYANSFIFNEIINEDDEVLQKQLLLGFIGSLHLTLNNVSQEDQVVIERFQHHGDDQLIY